MAALVSTLYVVVYMWCNSLLSDDTKHRPGANEKSVGALANFGEAQLKRIAQRPTKVAQIRINLAKFIWFWVAKVQVREAQPPWRQP